MFSLQVIIEGIIGSSFGEVAVDDFQFEDKICSTIPIDAEPSKYNHIIM